MKVMLFLPLDAIEVTESKILIQRQVSMFVIIFICQENKKTLSIETHQQLQQTTE